MQRRRSSPAKRVLRLRFDTDALRQEKDDGEATREGPASNARQRRHHRLLFPSRSPSFGHRATYTRIKGPLAENLANVERKSRAEFGKGPNKAEMLGAHRARLDRHGTLVSESPAVGPPGVSHASSLTHRHRFSVSFAPRLATRKEPHPSRPIVSSPPPNARRDRITQGRSFASVSHPTTSPRDSRPRSPARVRYPIGRSGTRSPTRYSTTSTSWAR